MKILVDINNKILKVLENDRSIFKGEQSADKLILYINQQLVNEYPVITGLLSNGRRIGPFTTDSSYGTETIDGITYTTAEFTLSKENGFTLTEGNTQVTIWIYKTKDTEVISKTAIGNITFNVVNTTSFNDGDIIISGDVEGTVVNIKVELENLQSSVNELNTKVSNIRTIDMGTFATNRPIEEGLKEFFIAAENLNLDYYDNRIFIGMVADIKVMAIGQAGGNLAVYTEKFEQYEVGYDDDDLLAVRHEPSKVRNVGAFETSTIEDGLKQFAKEVDRLHYRIFNYGTTTCLYTGEIAGDISVFTWYNSGDDVIKVFTPNTTYKVSNILDEENITITDISSYSKTEVDNKLTRSNLISTIGEATESLSGIMSVEDKKNLNTLVALLQDDENNITDTIKEVLAIFEQYPEGANLVSALAGKADKKDTYTKEDIKNKTIENRNLSAGLVRPYTITQYLEYLLRNCSAVGKANICYFFDKRYRGYVKVIMNNGTVNNCKAILKDLSNNKTYTSNEIDTLGEFTESDITYTEDSHYSKSEIDSLLADVNTKVMTIDVVCPHQLELTGNTGDEHGLAIDDQQMELVKIQGQTRYKSPNLLNPQNLIDAGMVAQDNGVFFVERPQTISGKNLWVNTRKIQTPLRITYEVKTSNGLSGTGIRVRYTDGTYDNFYDSEGLSDYKLYSRITNSSKVVDYVYQVWTRNVNTYFRNLAIYEDTTIDSYQEFDNSDLVNSNANLKSTGKNLINYINNIEFGSFTSSDGSATTSTTRLRTINPVKLPAGTYTLSFTGKLSHFVVYVYDLNENYLSSESKTNWELSGSNFTINGNRLVRFAFADYNDSTGAYDVTVATIYEVSDIMLNYGDTALPYESYKEDKASIGTELGVYDYIDVASQILHKGTSEVVTFNNSAETSKGTWSMAASSYTDLYRFDYVLNSSTTLNPKPFFAPNTYRGEGVCNRLDWTDAGSFDGVVTTNSICFSGNTKVYILLRKDLGVDTLAKFKTWLANNPVKFVYRIEPVDSQISIPTGYAVYSTGLQEQEVIDTSLPYILTKRYSLSLMAQVKSNIEVDRGQQKQINDLMASAGGGSKNRYNHRINWYDQSSNGTKSLHLVITNESSEAFTRETIKEYVANNGNFFNCFVSGYYTQDDWDYINLFSGGVLTYFTGDTSMIVKGCITKINKTTKDIIEVLPNENISVINLNSNFTDKVKPIND